MAAITVTCPSCSTSFPVDPAKIPEGGVNARCSSCGDIFRIEKPDPVPSVADLAPTEPLAPPEPATPPVTEEDAQAPPYTGQPETSPLAPPPLPDEPARAEPVAEGPAPSAPDLPAPTPSEPEVAPVPTEAARDDPFAQPAPFEEEEAVDEDEAVDEEADVEPLPTLDDIETTETAPAPEVEEALPEPEPSEPLPPLTDETLPAPEIDDAATAPSPQPSAAEPGEPAPAEEVAETSAPQVQGFTFGKRDPKDKAKRLARVLVSDMIMYNAERHQSALAQGTLQQDFEEEIEKSWKEFVEQVGEEMAEGEGRQYWTDALNDILAKGEKVF